MNDILVSFVVPSYNYGRYLKDCLESILNQEGNYKFEIIVIDDGSTDNTQQVLSNYSDKRLRIIRHPKNLGHIATINEGLLGTKGEFIARIDPDDRYRPYFLLTVLEKFFQFPDVGLVYGDACLINEDGKITVESCDYIHKGKDFKGNEFIKLLKDNFICSPAVIARREAWLKTLPVPKNLAFHDWYFTLMMARRYDFYYVNKVIAEYRVHPDNLHTKILREKKEEPSIFWLLDYIFENKETNLLLEKQKQKQKRYIYADHYFKLACRYFGEDMLKDCQRCCLKAIRYNLLYLFNFKLIRYLIGSILGKNLYGKIKLLFKK
ncbi:MAG: glycosyltransferase, partial [Candidatus Omnitrophica bacterium]|nr:glycosyltransferase [Candidatus Omnitrophota bacterium]